MYKAYKEVPVFDEVFEQNFSLKTGRFFKILAVFRVPSVKFKGFYLCLKISLGFFKSFP
ncbi:hypothetical protein M23134_01730 [Microscilla marina ATCC 23134]|uniref:Uncharacterized protein n=1 Tax=Microscilla marina ATCC 23134 TaxID=313606 RepID=A1ZSZ6_MICM2|nr:hypothetical protein M23134_01730 [Microscilla marina ATCC 23134]